MSLILTPKNALPQTSTSTQPVNEPWPPTAAKILSMFDTMLKEKTHPQAKGSNKSVFLRDIAGRKTALSVQPYVKMSPEMRKLWDAVDKTPSVQGEHLFPVDENTMVGVSDWQRGKGTGYKGDGFDVLNSEATVSQTCPYPNVAHNAIRLVLNTLLGPRQWYESALSQNMHECVLGDLKLEQYLIGTRGKPGREYAHLIMADLPTTPNPKDKSMGYFHPRNERTDTRYHSDDLFAIEAIIARSLFRLITAPLYEGARENPLDLSESEMDRLFMLLVGSEGHTAHLTENQLETWQKEGKLFYISDKGAYKLYPTIFDTKIADQELLWLFHLTQEKAQKQSTEPVHQVASCLIKCLQVAKEELDKALALEASSSYTPKKGQLSVLKAFNRLEQLLRSYLPSYSGITGSPTKKTIRPKVRKLKQSTLDFTKRARLIPKDPRRLRQSTLLLTPGNKLTFCKKPLPF